MSRQSRSFKLRLSPQGMDLLIDAHCHLIRKTRKLIAWGTTLHVAVAHLEQVPAAALAKDLTALCVAGLSGVEEHHLGAPNQLVSQAATIVDRVRPFLPSSAAPTLGNIYLLGLQYLVKAEGSALVATFNRVKA